MRSDVERVSLEDICVIEKGSRRGEHGQTSPDRIRADDDLDDSAGLHQASLLFLLALCLVIV